MTIQSHLRSLPGSHKATLRHIPGFAVVLALLALAGVVVPLMGGSYWSASASVGIAAMLAWRFCAMRLIFTDDALIYQGWFRRQVIHIATIEKLSRPADKGWPSDRLYGPSVFEITAPGARVRINLLWFGPGGAREFHDRLVSPRKRRRS